MLRSSSVCLMPRLSRVYKYLSRDLSVEFQIASSQNVETTKENAAGNILKVEKGRAALAWVFTFSWLRRRCSRFLPRSTECTANRLSSNFSVNWFIEKRIKNVHEVLSWGQTKFVIRWNFDEEPNMSEAQINCQTYSSLSEQLVACWSAIIFFNLAQ